MKTSPTISNLTKALLRAQTKMGAAVKGSSNPYFKSKYADLGAVMEATKEHLNSEGVLVLQPPVYMDGKNFIETTLIHAETGEFMIGESEVICAKQNDPQAFGAAQTYARRFGLQSMTFTPAEDDDGNYASGRSAAKTVYTKTEPQTGIGGESVKQVTAAGSAAKPTALVATQALPAGSVQATTVEPFKKTTSFSKKKKEEAAATPVATPASSEAF